MAKAQTTLGQYLEVGEIELTGLNPRKDFDDASLKELAASISEKGIIQPLTVTKDHRLIAGERRLRAAKLLGMKTVPVSDEEIPEIMLVENLQRKDLNCVEEAAGVAALLAKGMTQEDLAGKIGRSQAWVSTRARIALLPEKVKELAAAGKIGPEAMTELVPFVGYPIVENMTHTFTEINKHDKPKAILPDQVKDVIEAQLENGDATLNFNPDSWEREGEIMKLFNMKGCKGCGHTITHKAEYENKKKYCLNKECWEPRFKEADSKLKEREKARAKKAREGNESSGSRRSEREFRPLTKEPDDWHEPEFDRSACTDCDDKVMATKGKKKVGRCQKPSCWEKKQKEAKDAAEKQRRAMSAAVRKNLEKVLEGRPFGEKEMRYTLGILAEEVGMHGGNPLALWVKRPSGDWRVSVKGIPKADLGNAMLRVAVHREVERMTYAGDHGDKSAANLKEYFPELFDGLVQERITAKAGKADPTDKAEEYDDDEGNDGEEEEGA